MRAVILLAFVLGLVAGYAIFGFDSRSASVFGNVMAEKTRLLWEGRADEK